MTKGLFMLIDSQRAQWMKTTSQETGVILISNANLSSRLIDALGAEISDWPQMAWLMIKQSTTLEDEWLDAENRLFDAHRHSDCEARQLLSAIPKTCCLLDIEVSHPAHLAWLGSVCGHKMHFLQLARPEEQRLHDTSIDAQVEQIVNAARYLMKSYLKDHYLSPD